MSRTPNQKCCICDKEFYRRPHELAKFQIFFCRDHRSEAMLKYPDLFSSVGLIEGRSYWKDKKLPYKPTPRKSNEYHEITCKGCGVKYIIPDYKKIWKMGDKFCSQDCYRKNPPRGDTDIEKILENWLIENNFEYEKQKRIFKTHVDFFIEPNICLYADGDYWHSSEKRQIADERINNQLIESGYIVIRLKGSEIYA